MKEKIERWLDDYIEAQQKLYSLKNPEIIVDGQEIRTCFSDEKNKIHLHKCLQGIAKELGLEVRLVDSNYAEANPYYYEATYKGIKLFELSEEEW